MHLSVDKPAPPVVDPGPFSSTMLFSVDEPDLPVASTGPFSLTMLLQLMSLLCL